MIEAIGQSEMIDFRGACANELRSEEWYYSTSQWLNADRKMPNVSSIRADFMKVC
jgi:hypothetical protein